MGLPYAIILLDAAEEVTHPRTGKVLGVAVPDAGELAAVALSLCFMPARLLGAEVRFIRRIMGMAGQELAAAVEMDSATLSRWENGKQDVGTWPDKALRMAAVLRLQNRVPGSHLRPKDVVTISLAPRRDGAHPVIEVRRGHVDDAGGDTDVRGWDAEAKLAT